MKQIICWFLGHLWIRRESHIFDVFNHYDCERCKKYKMILKPGTLS